MKTAEVAKEVPVDKNHKKLLKKLKTATKKHEKHTERFKDAEAKVNKFYAKINKLEDDIAAYVEDHQMDVAPASKKQTNKRAS